MSRCVIFKIGSKIGKIKIKRCDVKCSHDKKKKNPKLASQNSESSMAPKRLASGKQRKYRVQK